LIVLLLLLAVTMGWSISTSPGISIVVTVVIGSLALGLFFARRSSAWLRTISRKPASTLEHPGVVTRSSPELALPRFLYYFGAATVAVLAIRPTSALTLSDWFFLASLVLTVSVLMMTRRLRFVGLPKGLAAGLLVYSAGAFMSSLQTDHTLSSLSFLLRFVYVTGVWFWLGTVVLETPKHVRTATLCWTLSVALSGAASIVQVLAGDVIPGAVTYYGRMSGLAQHFNDLGGMTSVALIPAAMISSVVATRQGKLASFIVVSLIGAGLLLSGSIGAMIGAGAGSLAWVAMGRLTRRAVVVVLMVGLALLSVLRLQQGGGAPSPIERLRGTTDSSSEYCSLCSRVETNRAAWQSIKQHPLIGVGLDPVSNVTETGFQVHNTLLGSWYETGFPGFLGMVAILVSVATSAINAMRAARSREEWLICAALLASFVVLFVNSMSAPILFQRYGWLGAALVLAMRHQQQRRGISTQAVTKRLPGVTPLQGQRRWGVDPVRAE